MTNENDKMLQTAAEVILRNHYNSDGTEMLLHNDGHGLNRDDMYGSRVLTLDRAYKGLPGVGSEIAHRWNTYQPLVADLTKARKSVNTLSNALRECIKRLEPAMGAEHEFIQRMKEHIRTGE